MKSSRRCASKSPRARCAWTSCTPRWSEIEPELKRYERALALLTGEAPQLGRKKRDPNAARVRTLPSGISEERMGDIREAILRYCQDHDEFRQVDIRSTLKGTLAKSSIMANAFERMRQDGFIRMARQEGRRQVVSPDARGPAGS